MESKIYEDSFGKYWRNSKGQLHREDDLPAIESNNGYKVWYIDGKIHREIGPASIWSNGIEYWCLNDIYYTPENMPHFLYVNYLKWEYKKKHGML